MNNAAGGGRINADKTEVYVVSMRTILFPPFIRHIRLAHICMRLVRFFFLQAVNVQYVTEFDKF